MEIIVQVICFGEFVLNLFKSFLKQRDFVFERLGLVIGRGVEKGRMKIGGRFVVDVVRVVGRRRRDVFVCFFAFFFVGVVNDVVVWETCCIFLREENDSCIFSFLDWRLIISDFKFETSFLF